MSHEITTERSDKQDPDEILDAESKKLLKNGSLIGIVVTIRMYKSLSTPEISKLLNIKKTTLFNYINQLEDEGFIEVDEERSSKEFLSKGARARKYYRPTKLTEDVLKYYSEQTESYESILEEIENITKFSEEERIQHILKQFKSLKETDFTQFARIMVQVNETIMNITLKKIGDIAKMARDGVDDKLIIEKIMSSFRSTYNTININPFTIDFYSPDQAREFMSVYYKFQQEIYEMRRRFENSDEKKNPEIKSTQYLFMYSSPIQNDVFEE